MVNETATVIGGGTDIIALYLFGVIALFLLAILVYIIIIFRRRYLNQTVKFTILYNDGSSKFKRIKNPSKLNKVFNKSYKFDHKALIKRKFGQEIIYKNNIKEPIIFNNIKILKDLDVKQMSSKELDDVINEKITEKLFGETGLGKTEVLLIVIIGVLAVILFMIYDMKTKGVTLTPEALNMMKESFRAVINGV